MAKYYILVGKNIVPSTLYKMNKWFKDNKSEVKFTRLSGGSVRTSFIGINQSFGVESPKVFETKVEGCDEIPTEHWSSWQQAEVGHDQIVEKLSKLHLSSSN